MERETAKVTDEGSGFSAPISLTLPSSPEYVLLARLVMGQAGRLAGLEPEEIYDLKLAITEAVTNVIRHASVQNYEIEYRIFPSGVEVSVRPRRDPQPRRRAGARLDQGRGDPVEDDPALGHPRGRRLRKFGNLHRFKPNPVDSSVDVNIQLTK
jgi:anti-sigma regulatory factor (Ser/Thr protein kinase)